MRVPMLFFKFLIVAFIVSFLGSCVTVYTEKRSEALSRAVAATADSVQVARFDLASKYSKEAERIAFPPKERIEIKPLITKNVKAVEITNTKTQATQTTNLKTTPTEVKTSIVKIDNKDEETETVLRLVVPEHLKHAKLLVENSEEWNELLKTKEFSKQLEQDNANLKKLAQDVTDELEKQKRMNDQMIKDLNDMKTKLGKKDAAIWIRNFIILILVLTLGGGVYLRMKGVL